MLIDDLNMLIPDVYQPYIEKFHQYLELLKKWNKSFNLTALKNNSDLVNLHILDSLSIDDELKGQEILDVGTGAGLPGFILAIVNPDKRFTLLDSNGKKTRFLTQVKISLALNNVTVVQSRIENFTPTEKFTTITSRAFSSLKTFYDLSHKLLASDGVLLAMKGQLSDAELLALKRAENELLVSHKKLDLPDHTRYLIRLMIDS